MITKQFILDNVHPICEKGMDAFIAYKGSALEYLREDPRGNKAAAYCIQQGNEKIRACRAIAKIAVAQDGFAFPNLPEVLKTDRELAKIAVAQNGWAFQYLPEVLKTDREIAKIAVAQNGWAFQYLPESLKNDPEIKELLQI